MSANIESLTINRILQSRIKGLLMALANEQATTVDQQRIEEELEYLKNHHKEQEQVILNSYQDK